MGSDTPQVTVLSQVAMSDQRHDVGTFVITDGKTAAKPTMPKIVTVQTVIDEFLGDTESRVSPECYRQYQKHLRRFAAKFGHRPAESLTVEEVEDYSKKPEWSPSYRNGVLGTVVSAFRWAVSDRRRLIRSNPLAGIKKPKKQSRGRKAIISPADHAKLIEHADADWKEYLALLWETGARPGEIAGLTVDDLDLANKMVILAKHKTAEQTGEDRIIHLTDTALAILQRRLATHPEGLLFPGEDGQRLSANNVACRMRRLCERAGVKAFCYSYRHTYGTDALSKGIPDAVVATLMGHTGTATLHRHYSHLTSRNQVLRQAIVGQERVAVAKAT
jgi:integrase/recombinase XerC